MTAFRNGKFQAGMADIGRKADLQKRRPKRPPKLNGGALHLGRVAPNKGVDCNSHWIQVAVTECRAVMPRGNTLYPRKLRREEVRGYLVINLDDDRLPTPRSVQSRSHALPDRAPQHGKRATSSLPR